MSSVSAKSFILHNKTEESLLISIEPEGVLYPLGENERVTVHDQFVEKPATVAVTQGEKNEMIISIWPGDGELVVEKDGKDVLELVAACEMPAD